MGMNYKSDALPDGTIELTLTIPWTDIQNTYKTVLTEMASSTEIAGFRKGKAPKEIVEQQADKTKVYEETIKRLVPKAYSDAVTEANIKPIIMPQVELKDAQEGKDWTVTAKTCERPEVSLGDYKKAVAALKAKSGQKIFVPGAEKADDKPKGPSVDDVLDAILGAVTAKIPAILLDHEVTHQLSQLVDQTRKLGLTVDQYLASTGKTADGLRTEYRNQAQRNLTLEFALEAIADREQVTVTDQEIDSLIKSSKTEEERKALESQKYYLASLIRRQKTVDLLVK